MPTNVNKLPSSLLEDAARNLGWDDDKEPLDSYIRELEEMEPEQVFDRFLCWNGIQGYSQRLYEAVLMLERAKKHLSSSLTSRNLKMFSGCP